MTRHRLVKTLMVAGVLLCGARGASAQTTGAGPYYATPSWDQTLACTALASCPRFIVLANFNNEAVLDRETGLVWERSPSESLESGYNSARSCSHKVVGNRQGWRLPTIQEARSLLDPSKQTPALPDGHPFTNLHVTNGDFYWTSTDNPFGGVYIISLANAAIDLATERNFESSRPWCVRGGQSAPLQ